MKLDWLTCALRCCGKPGIFHTLLYVSLGTVFLLGPDWLGPGMTIVGLLMILLGAGICAVILLITYGRSPRGRCCAR